MTPESLNPPGASIQDQNQLSNFDNHDSTSLPCRTFFDIRNQRQIGDITELTYDHQEDDKRVFHGGSSSNNNDQVYNNSSFVSSHQPVMADPSSARCMSSKIRLTRKMMSSGNPSSYNRNSIITRVCADCNTSSTPLWRSGPNGPKTLCNACGIRQRKARKAMSEAANGFDASTDASIATKTTVHHKKKKRRTNHFGKFKNKCKATTTSSSSSSITASGGTSQGELRKLHLKDYAISLRSNSAIQLLRDEEVAQAALLLMELSCGFLHF